MLRYSKVTATRLTGTLFSSSDACDWLGQTFLLCTDGSMRLALALLRLDGRRQKDVGVVEDKALILEEFLYYSYCLIPKVSR
jgi:hypothetical protein